MRFAPSPFSWLILVALLPACSGSGGRSQSFDSPQTAVDSLVAALAANDDAALARYLGPEADALLNSGDAVQDSVVRGEFLESFRSQHAIQEDGSDRRVLVVGEQEWPLPIPIVQRQGRWSFDGEAGVEELVYRRVGRNELGAIAVCRGVVEAQKEYASTGHDGDPPGIYALKLISDEGQENGLYWPTGDAEAPSPAGPFVAAAAAEGYRRGAGLPYHGYRYRMLYRQGASASGGATDYFEGGILTRGFALVAWPAEYGISGIMTFLVNQDGVVYQKDLGDDSGTAVEEIDSFDPGPGWEAVPEAPEADS